MAGVPFSHEQHFLCPTFVLRTPSTCDSYMLETFISFFLFLFFTEYKRKENEITPSFTYSKSHLGLWCSCGIFYTDNVSDQIGIRSLMLLFYFAVCLRFVSVLYGTVCVRVRILGAAPGVRLCRPSLGAAPNSSKFCQSNRRRSHT